MRVTIMTAGYQKLQGRGRAGEEEEFAQVAREGEKIASSKHQGHRNDSRASEAIIQLLYFKRQTHSPPPTCNMMVANAF